MTTIYLIRHGEVHNPDAILYGRIPGFRISDNGHAQAQAAAAYLADQPLEAIYASPQQRAQETAAHIAKPHQHPITTDERLDESYTIYEGHPLTEMAAKDWDLYTGVPAPYEQPDDILTRTLDFIAHTQRTYPGQQVAAVTHGDVVVFAYMHFKGIYGNIKQRTQLYQHGIQDAYPATASITTLTFTDDDTPTVTYNRPY
jgi:broad specificity phosphatase PhoE